MALLALGTAGTLGSAHLLLCAVHCVLTPVALSFAPALSQFLPGDTQVHPILVVLVVSFGLLAFVPGYRRHRKRSSFYRCSLVSGRLDSDPLAVHRLDRLREKCLTILGSTLIITASRAESDILQILRPLQCR